MSKIPVAASRAVALWAVLFVIGVGPARATPPLTTIQDQLFRADGTPINATLLITWKGFVASDNSNVPANTLRIPVIGGLLRLKLVPTTTALPPASYTVMYLVDGRLTNTETWSVPVSTSPLTIRMVRTSNPIPQPPADTSIQVADIAGLSDALADRPAKGSGYLPGRILVPDANGDLSGLNGSANQCVRGDGSLGAFGSNPNFFDLECPTGDMNGTNSAFRLSKAPKPAASLLLFRNGLLQRIGVDYVLNGPVVTFREGSVPQPGDVIPASYRADQ